MEMEGEEREIEKKKERERETGLHPIIAARDLLVISDNPIPKKLRCPSKSKFFKTLLTSIILGGEISPRKKSRWNGHLENYEGMGWQGVFQS